MYLCSSHRVTSSTWWAQALFLRMGASPCQITRICWVKKLLDDQDNCQITRICWGQYWLNFQRDSDFVMLSKMISFLEASQETPTFRPFGVSTPTSPYWILLLWKLVTRLSRSPWKNSIMPLDVLCGAYCLLIEFPPPPPHTSSSSSTSRVLLIPESA